MATYFDLLVMAFLMILQFVSIQLNLRLFGAFPHFFPYHVFPSYPDINLNADFMADCAILIIFSLLDWFLHSMICSSQYCMPLCKNSW